MKIVKASTIAKFQDGKMTSRYIAELTGKIHKNVMKDIRDEFDDLGEVETSSYFEPVEYKDAKGENRAMYLLTELGTVGLLSRYDKSFRRLVEKEWLEFKKAEVFIPSYQIEDPIARAKVWITEYEEVIRLNTKINEQAAYISILEDLIPNVRQKTARQVFNEMARQVAIKLNLQYGSTYTAIYKEHLYRYNINLKVRSKNENMTVIEYAEEHNFLEELILIANEMLRGILN